MYTCMSTNVHFHVHKCTPACTQTQIVLSSDEEVFGGYRNCSKDAGVTFVAQPMAHDNRPFSFLVSGVEGQRRAPSWSEFSCS